MIIGILLGVALAISITSFLIILTSAVGVLRENVATGAVIGTSQAISYATVSLIASLVVTLLLVLILIKSTFLKH
ncbi:hypothetical protein K8R30_01375 [archaeon]|nr:hypothetical protein [archaeon]